MRFHKFVLAGMTVLVGVSAGMAQTETSPCNCNSPANNKPVRFPLLRSFFHGDRNSNCNTCGHTPMIAKSTGAPPLANSAVAKAPTAQPGLALPAPPVAPSLDVAPEPNTKVEAPSLALRVDTIPGSQLPAPVPIRALQPSDFFPDRAGETPLVKGDTKVEAPAQLPALIAEPVGR